MNNKQKNNKNSHTRNPSSHRDEFNCKCTIATASPSRLGTLQKPQQKQHEHPVGERRVFWDKTCFEKSNAFKLPPL